MEITPKQPRDGVRLRLTKNFLPFAGVIVLLQSFGHYLGDIITLLRRQVLLAVSGDGFDCLNRIPLDLLIFQNQDVWFVLELPPTQSVIEPVSLREELAMEETEKVVPISEVGKVRVGLVPLVLCD